MVMALSEKIMRITLTYLRQLEDYQFVDKLSEGADGVDNSLSSVSIIGRRIFNLRFAYDIDLL